MLNVTHDDVKTDPYPHVISEQILDPAFYAELRKDYPTAQTFECQKSKTGLSGSRTGQGFDIYRGDPTYDKLVATSKAWKEFDHYINSTAFIDKVLELFGPHLEEIGCRAEIRPDMYNPALVEGREGMTVAPTLKERMANWTRSFRPKSSLGAVELFTRLDIHKALKGYNKEVHCDRANRLISFVMYFVDADKEGIEGGTLTIHKHREQKRPNEYERHPKAEDAPVIAKLRPKENMGVIFTCNNNSYHGVEGMKSNGAERDYLYINISGNCDRLW